MVLDTSCPVVVSSGDGVTDGGCTSVFGINVGSCEASPVNVEGANGSVYGPTIDCTGLYDIPGYGGVMSHPYLNSASALGSDSVAPALINIVIGC